MKIRGSLWLKQAFLDIISIKKSNDESFASMLAGYVENSSYEHAWRSDMHQTTFESWLIFDISPYTYWRMGIVIICICISLMFVIMWYLYPSKYSQRFWLFQIWLSLCLFGIRVEGLRNGKVLVVTNVKQVLQFH